MKVSTKTRYGLRFLLDLALHGGAEGDPVALGDIAERQRLSEKYLWQVAAPLKAAGLVRAYAGTRGGYVLNREIGEVTALDVLETMEGPVCLVDCVQDDRSCGRVEECALREVWRDVSRILAEAMKAVTLADLVKQTVRHTRSPVLDYQI